MFPISKGRRPGWTSEQALRPATAEEHNRFRDLLRSLGAPFSLAGVSFYRFTRLGEVENRRKRRWLQVEQFHAELLQAIALGQPNFWQRSTGRRADIEELQRLLSLIPNSGWTPVDEFSLMDSEQVAELLRGETRFVRNWAEPHQLLTWLRELFEPLDEQYRKSIGINLTDLVRLFERMTERLNDRSEYFVRWHNALAAAERADWVRLAREYWPDSASTIATAEELSERGDRELLLHEPLPSLYTWRIDELESLVNSGTIGLTRVLDEWSMRPASKRRSATSDARQPSLG